ncbi:efflux RND transporter periplasmic adaptor subunit [Sphingobium sp. CAP-1]|uniref:efflux RND transporter periplasmic adaptor subunit n=1 Tax=Sphingobium sp. CAP-1 TaxID=2676077 RepID=UPI0012BB3CEF|nr:efflux RND transporter periplasmic adaptor subunit [Sphingobium sp. CAP-1]QGP81435.1 efflux RND transporter periplasmic adaptor subunit [Sphingobium sp. CAP-1]
MRVQLRRGVVLLITTVILGAGCVVFFLGGENRPARVQADADAPVQASVAAIARRDADLWQEFSGRFEAVEAVEVRARVSGAIRSIYFREGALVRRGDLLLLIDPDPYRAEVDRLAGQVAAAEARARFTRSEADRADRLIETDAIAARDRDRRANDAAEAAANLRTARAALRAAQLNLSYTQVRAPIAGRIGRRAITPGNLVDAGPGAPVLTTILSVDPIYAGFEADEDTVARALASIRGNRSHVGTIPVSAMLDGAPMPIVGHLQLVDNQVDARAGTVRLRATFANPNGLFTPGQFTRIRLGQAHREPVILVPEAAIGTDQSRRFVLVLGPDNRTIYREVQLGQLLDGMRVVTQGLRPGERIVISNLQRLKPGALVQPRNAPMAVQAS